jgi:hypothetical protein
VLVLVVIELEVSVEVLRVVIYPVPLCRRPPESEVVDRQSRALAGSLFPHIK